MTPPSIDRVPSGAPEPEDNELLEPIIKRMSEVAATVGIPDDKITSETIRSAARRALAAEERRGAPVTEADFKEGKKDMLLVDALIAQRETEAVSGDLVQVDNVVVSLKAWQEARNRQ